MNEQQEPNDARQISGIITNPCIVTFTGVPETTLLPHALKLLCGVVVQDNKGRLEPGMQFRSSPINRIAGDIIETANSLYKVEGEIDYVTLPFKYLKQVLGLIDPRDIKTLIEAGYTNITYTNEHG